MKKALLYSQICCSITMLVLPCQAITVSGYAYLEGQADHGGILIKFQRTEPSALFYEIVTNSSGYFSAEIELGIYNITYAKNGYFNKPTIVSQPLLTDIILTDIYLKEHTAVVLVPEQFSSISEALFASFDGDTILLSDGIYSGDKNTNLTWNGLEKHLVIKSKGGPDNCIIDCQGTTRAFIFNNSGQSESDIITGLQIINGSANGGGAIFCSLVSLIIENNIFRNNSVSGSGGALFCRDGKIIAKNNSFINNLATVGDGGAIFFENISSTFSSNFFAENKALYSGGGVSTKGGSITIDGNIFDANSNYGDVNLAGGGLNCLSSATILNNIFRNNTAYLGGGIMTGGAFVSIFNNVFENNTAAGGGGIYISNCQIGNGFKSEIISSTFVSNIATSGCGGIAVQNCDNCIIKNNILFQNINGGIGSWYNGEAMYPVVTYNNSWGNTVFNYSCGSWVGVNVTSNTNGTDCDLYRNIQVDPLLVDAESGNYKLQDKSPCIRAGTKDGSPATDKENIKRGNPPDMGAFENTNDTIAEIYSPGWNLISSYMIPYDSTLSSLLADLSPNLVIMKNMTGQVYWPEFDINQIINWNEKQGYQVYLSSQDTLVIAGRPMVPDESPLILETGWNMISYLRTTPMAIETALANITAALLIAKDGRGQVYWPEFSINNIGDMQPGQGYQMYLTAAATLTYPANDVTLKVPASTVRQMPAPIHYTSCRTNTGGNAVLLISLPGMPDGAEVGAWVAGHLLVGSGVVYQGRAVLTLWGDDPMTKESDGAQERETLHLSCWITGQNGEFKINCTTLKDGMTQKELSLPLEYNRDAVLVAETDGKINIAADSILPAEFGLEQNYPNPFNSSTTIKYQLPRTMKVELVVYNLSGAVMQTLVDGIMPAGVHEITWNGRDQRERLAPSGIYWIRMKSGDFEKIGKISLIR